MYNLFINILYFYWCLSEDGDLSLKHAGGVYVYGWLVTYNLCAYAGIYYIWIWEQQDGEGAQEIDGKMGWERMEE
jgi:hypothetical protein